jgi:hypothetical protein
MRSLLLWLLLLSPALGGLKDVLFQLELDCAILPGAQGPATVELANGGSGQVAVPGLSQAQVWVNVTTHRMGVAYVTFQVRSNQPVELLTPEQQVVMLGQAPSEFSFRVPGQEVCLRTRALRVATPGVPILQGDPMPIIPGLMPADPGMPNLALPPGMEYSAPPGFVLPGNMNGSGR